MKRPDLSTLACVNSEFKLYCQTDQGNLVIRKVYGQDRIRLLWCRRCQEEFSERRGTALFNTKLSEAKAVDVIDHLDEGCSFRATARLTKVAKESVAASSKSVAVMLSAFILKRCGTSCHGQCSLTNNGVMCKKTEKLWR